MSPARHTIAIASGKGGVGKSTGTADLQQEVTRVLELSGAVVVVGPQDAAHLDAKRVVELFQLADVRVIGGVENMSGLICPHCGEHVEVFPPSPPTARCGNSAFAGSRLCRSIRQRRRTVVLRRSWWPRRRVRKLGDSPSSPLPFGRRSAKSRVVPRRGRAG